MFSTNIHLLQLKIQGHLEKLKLNCLILTIATSPMGFKPKFWKRYADSILEIIHKDGTLTLTNDLNTVDPTGNIKFTHEEEDQGRISFRTPLFHGKTSRVWYENTHSAVPEL